MDTARTGQSGEPGSQGIILVSIGVIELTKVVWVLNLRLLSMSVEFILLVAALCFAICQILTLTGLWLEKRWQVA